MNLLSPTGLAAFLFIVSLAMSMSFVVWVWLATMSDRSRGGQPGYDQKARDREYWAMLGCGAYFLIGLATTWEWPGWVSRALGAG